MFDMEESFACAQGTCQVCKNLHVVGSRGNKTRTSYWSTKLKTTVFICAKCAPKHIPKHNKTCDMITGKRNGLGMATCKCAKKKLGFS